MCLLAKRLERRRFVWPRTKGEAVTITAAQLGYRMEGIDWRLPQGSWRPLAAGQQRHNLADAQHAELWSERPVAGALSEALPTNVGAAHTLIPAQC